MSRTLFFHIVFNLSSLVEQFGKLDFALALFGAPQYKYITIKVANVIYVKINLWHISEI